MGFVVSLYAQELVKQEAAAFRAREERRAQRAAMEVARTIAPAPSAPVRATVGKPVRSHGFKAHDCLRDHNGGVCETPAIIGTMGERKVFNLAYGTERSAYGKTGLVGRGQKRDGFGPMPEDTRGDCGNWATVGSYRAPSVTRNTKPNRAVGGSTIADGNNGGFIAKAGNGKLA